MNTVVVETIEEFLKVETALVGKLFRSVKKRRLRLNGYLSISDFIFRNGRNFDPAKTTERWRGVGKPNQCFHNSLSLAMRHKELIYVEGYYLAGFPIPLPHAWCVMPDGSVVEPTLPDLMSCEGYFGVPIQTRFAAKIVKEVGRYGVLDVPEMDWPVLTAQKKEWAVKLP